MKKNQLGMFPKMEGSCPNLENRWGCVAAELPAPASRVLTQAWHTLTHERSSDGLPRTLRLDRLWGAPVSRPALLLPWEGTPAGLVELCTPGSSSLCLPVTGWARVRPPQRFPCIWFTLLPLPLSFHTFFILIPLSPLRPQA